LPATIACSTWFTSDSDPTTKPKTKGRFMIHELHGDILLSSAAAIAHGVSPGDHFGEGLALQLREQWPAMVRDFRHYCHNSHPKVGELWTWAAPTGLRIVNLLTQEAAPDEHARPGRAKLEHVNHALRALRKLVETEKLRSVALPKLATGVGGLSWPEVRGLIDQHLADFAGPVYLYTLYQKGVAAVEPPASSPRGAAVNRV
jgi:O-acetyl-ADP-ribose deacetylase (regulator of RNase III)